MGRVLFAPAVDTDGDPATNPSAGHPVPVVDLAGELMGVVSLAAQLVPNVEDQAVIGVPLTFVVETADGSEFSRTVRSDAWGAATARFPLEDLSGNYTYQVSAPGYGESGVRRFRLDPDWASYTVDFDGAELSYEQLGDGALRFTLRSSVPLDAGRDEAVLYALRGPLAEEELPDTFGGLSRVQERDAVEKADEADRTVPLPLLNMEITGRHTAAAEVQLPQGAYGIVGSVTLNGDETLVAYSPSVALAVDTVAEVPASPCVWASGMEFGAGQTMIRLEDDGDRVIFDLVPTAQVPDVIPTPENPGVFVKTWRTGPFDWHEVRYNIQVESLVDDGKKTVTLQDFDYDPIARRYTLAIRSLLDEPVTDTLRVDVLGPAGVVLLHEDQEVVLEPGRALLYEIEVPAELGEPEGLRVALDDPLDAIVSAVKSVGRSLVRSFVTAPDLDFHFKYYGVIVGYKWIEETCSLGTSTTIPCKRSTPPVPQDVAKSLLKDMLSSAELVLGSMGLDMYFAGTKLFEIDAARCPSSEAMERAKARLAQCATDLTNLMDAIQQRLSKPVDTPKFPLPWVPGLMAWGTAGPFFKGGASAEGLALRLGVETGLKLEGKVGFSLNWEDWLGLGALKSLQDLWGLICAFNSILNLLEIAEEIDKMTAEGSCDPPKPDDAPPDDRQDVWQAYGELYEGETHEETISNLIDLVERARELGLWRAERLLLLELRRAELARLMADRAAQMAYVEDADTILQTWYDDLHDLLQGTMPIAPGETITETWAAISEQAVTDLHELDYAQRQQQLDDAFQVAQRGYEELYGEELALQHELRELLMADTVGVLAAGFADATMGALEATGLPHQLISPWSSGGTFLSQDAPYVPPESAPQLLVVPAGAMARVASSPETRAWLEAYVDGGGVLIVFTQAHGEDWAALPGGEVAGVGYLEDQRCQHASVEAAVPSDWLVWMGVERPDIQVDGAFTAWPADATILLRRTKGDYAGFPAMIEYPYGQGAVVATSAYGDWASQTAIWWGDDWPMTRTILLRAWLLTRGRDVDTVPVGDPSSSVTVSFPVTNTATYTATEVRVGMSVLAVTLFWSWRIQRYETSLSQTIVPGESVVLTADVPTPSVWRGVHNWTRVGLYRTEVTVEGSTESESYRSWGPIVYVRSPVDLPELALHLQPERGRANLFETVMVTATVSSSGSEDATVVLNPERDLPGGPVTRTVPAMSQIQQPYAVTMETSKRPGLRLESEAHEYLGHASTAVYLDTPRLVASVGLPPTLEDSSVLSLTVENQGLGVSLGASAAMTLTAPDGAPVWTDAQTLPTLAAGDIVTLPFVLALPSGCRPELGTYTLWYRVDDGRGLTKASPVPLPTLDWQWALDQQAYRVREQLSFTATLQNVGRFNLAPVVTVTVPAAGFEVVQTPSLPPGTSASLAFAPTLSGTLAAGAYPILLEAHQGSTITGTETFVVAPSEIEASVAAGPYQAGDNLTVTLSNVGGADSDVDYDLCLYGVGTPLSRITGTLSLQAGASGPIALSIPAQAADGSAYLLRLLADDQAAGRSERWSWPLVVEGVAADVGAWTLDRHYRAGETVTATGAVSVTAGSLLSAPLSLAVYGGGGDILYDHLEPGIGSDYRRLYPAIAADGDGNAFAVWEDDRYGDNIYFAYRSVTSDTWSANVNLDAVTGAPDSTDSPDIAVDYAGNVHVVWRDHRERLGDIYYARRTAAGLWSEAEPVYEDDGLGYDMNPAIAVDGAGNAYVVWQHRPDGTYDWYVQFATRPLSGAWSAAERIDTVSDPTPSQMEPAIGVDDAGTAYVVWHDTRTGSHDIYSSYRPVTGTWASSVKVSDDTGTATKKFADIVVDGSGHAYAAWQDYRDSIRAHIYFAHRPPGGAWSNNEKADPTAGDTDRQWYPSIGVTAGGPVSGTVYVTWDKWSYPYVSISLASRSPQGDWSATEDVTTAPTDAGEHPDIAIDGTGSAHVIWSDYRSGTAYDIYARKRLSTGDWEESEIKVNDDDTAAQPQWEPAVGVTPGGDAFAVWTDERNGNSDIYFSHRPVGGTWGPAERVNDDAGADDQYEPRIAVDPQGNAYAVWTDERTGPEEVYFAHRPISGAWGTNERVNIDPAGAWPDPDIAVDSEGNAYVVWAGRAGMETGYEIYFRYRAPDGTWSAEEVVDDDAATPSGSNRDMKPDIDVDAAGNAHVAWVALVSDPWGYNIYADYRPAGATWGPDVEVTDDPGTAFPYYVALTVDAAGNAHALWLDWREEAILGEDSWTVYGAYKPAGGSWSANERVDDDPERYRKADERIGLDADEDGNVFAVWEDTRWREDPTDDDYYDVALAYRPVGGEWGPQVPVNERRGDVEYHTDVAADAQGNAHVVWIGDLDGLRVARYATVRVSGALWSRALMVTTASTWPFSESVGTLNARPGRYILAATLENSLGQTLARSREPFYIHPLSTTLTLETDRDVYGWGDTVHISGWVTNTGTTSHTWDLAVAAGTDTLYTETLQLDADEGTSYAVTTVITQNLLLTASAGPAEVSNEVAVGEPEISGALEMPDTVGRDPFTATLVLTNMGQVSAALQIDFDGRARRTVSVDAGGTALAQASMSITDSREVEVVVSGDATLTLTRWITQGATAELALLEGGANVVAGPVSWPYTITNPGSLPISVELSATLESETPAATSRGLLILGGQVYQGEVTFDVPPGEHRLTLVLFDAYGRELTRHLQTLWAREEEAPEEPHAILFGVTPWPQPVAAGQALSATLAVRNEGAGGTAVAGVQAFEVQHQRPVSLTGQLTQTVALTVPVPVDAPAGEYIGRATIDGDIAPFTFTVSGVDVGLALSLDQTGYISGEVASLLVTLTENTGLSGDHGLAFRYLDAEDYVTVTVPAHQVVEHTFTFTATAPGRASVSLGYTRSEAGQRIIMIDSLPVPVSDPAQGFVLTHDKAVYDAGDTIQLTLEIYEGVGSLTLMGPMELMWRDGDFLLWSAPFDATGMQVAPGTYPFSVQLPADLSSGQYGFLLQVNGESLYHSVDVRGWRVTSMGLTLDKVRYARQDALEAVGQFFNEGETINGLTLSAWVVPPGGETGFQLTPPVSRTVDLRPGLHVFTATGVLDSPYVGTHRLVLSLQTSCGCCRVVGASTHFDVGWAHLVELETDQGTYALDEPGEGTLVVYGHGPTSLVVTVINGTTVLDEQPELSGFMTLTFTIPTTPTGSYLLAAHSTDQNGNTDSLLRAYAVPEPRDTQPPSVELTYPPTVTVITSAAPTTTLTVEGLATDDSGQLTAIVDGQTLTPTATGAFSVAVELAQGINLVSAVAIDASGNVSFTPIIPVYMVPGHGLTFSVDRMVAEVGDQVTYRAVLTSSGVLSDVSVLQSLPAGIVSDVGVSAPRGWTDVIDLDPDWHAVNWAGDLLAGEPLTVTVETTLTMPGTLTQTARACWGWGAVEESDPLVVVVNPAAGPLPPINVAAGAVEVKDDGICSLREAIANANAGGQIHDDCGLGSAGTNTINLAPNGVYILPDGPYTGDGPNGLPDITSTIVISGSGATIARSGAGGTPDFRIFHVGFLGNLTLNHVALRNGKTPDGSPGLNSGAGGDGGHGGAVYNAGGIVTLLDCTVAGNATGSGGAAESGNGGDGGNGGGIYNLGGTAQLVNTTVSGNATGGGGNRGGEGQGGDIYSSDDVFGATNSTMSGNATGAGGDGGTGGDGGSGGGIANMLGEATVAHCTISGNSTGAGGSGGTGGVEGGGGNGGGVYESSGNTTHLKNSIVAGNTAAGEGPDCDGRTGTIDSQDYNLIGDVTACSVTGITVHNITGADPKLGPLALNPPGKTETCALGLGSPAIDAIPMTSCPVFADQRGVCRPQGPNADIGAYECEVGVEVPVGGVTVPATRAALAGPMALLVLVVGPFVVLLFLRFRRRRPR